MRKKTILVLAFLLTGIPVGVNAAPKLLPFQGHLTDATGTPVSDGAKVVQFKIYDAPVSGTAAWAGEVHKLSVNKGLVNTILGTKTSMAGVDFSGTLYLEITVDANADEHITAADPPLLPRQVILPAVFAKGAEVAGKLQDADGNAHNWSAVFEGGIPGNGKIHGDKLTANSISADRLSGSISGGQLTEGTITSREIGAGAVGDEEIGSVTRLTIPGNGGAVGAQVDANGALDIKAVAAPGAAQAGFGKLYLRESDDQLVFRGAGGLSSLLTFVAAYYVDQKDNGVHGGAAIIGAQVRELNKSVFEYGDSITRNGNTIRLKTGLYYVEGSAPAYTIGAHRTYVFQMKPSGKDAKIHGTSEHNLPSGSTTTRSHFRGMLEVTEEEAEADFQIWHYLDQAHGLGADLGHGLGHDGNPEIYTEIFIQKVR